MESNTEDPTDSSAGNIRGRGEEGNGAAAVDLLEEVWFFRNLFHGNGKHTTSCLYDPCSSSSDCNSGCESRMKPNEEPSQQQVPPCVPDEKACPPVEKYLDGGRSPSKKLIPDCPPCSSSSYDDQSDQFHSPSSSEKTIEEVWDETDRWKPPDGTESGLRKRSPNPFLLKAPSLPPSIGREDVRIEERLKENSHPRMSKSNRQSSLNFSNSLPPRHSSKGMPNYRSQISSEEDMRRRLLNRTKSIKSRGELEHEELQGFKDLGFTFDKNDLSPRVVDILPGLQEKKDGTTKEAEEDQRPREPYLSEAWLSQSFAPPVPKWTPRGSAEEEVKAHIKFWARAVASNVQLEC